MHYVSHTISSHQPISSAGLQKNYTDQQDGSSFNRIVDRANNKLVIALCNDLDSREYLTIKSLRNQRRRCSCHLHSARVECGVRHPRLFVCCIHVQNWTST